MKTAIIGTGGIGERHLRCAQLTGRTEVICCEPNPEKRAIMKERYGVEGYASLDELLAVEGLKAAVICTPAQTHIPIAQQCLERGIHVLIEKPLSVSEEGIDALLETVRKTGLQARVAYVHRSIPLIQRVREEVQSGRYGTLKHVTVVGGQNYPSFRPDYREIYYARRETGGGTIQDAMTHSVHGVEWIAGPIEELACVAGHQVLAGVEVDDTANLVARHRSGAMSSFTVNQFQAPNENVLTFHCEKGSVRADVTGQRLGVATFESNQWQWEEVSHGERDTMFIAQIDSFLNAAEGKDCHLSTVEDARQTLRVNLAALKSSDHREFVRI